MVSHSIPVVIRTQTGRKRTTRARLFDSYKFSWLKEEKKSIQKLKRFFRYSKVSLIYLQDMRFIVNFINILHENIFFVENALRSFSLVTFWLCDFLTKMRYQNVDEIGTWWKS